MINRTIAALAALVAASALLTACGGPGRSASRAGTGVFDDRNALEPSPCACMTLPQVAPDAGFWKRLGQPQEQPTSGIPDGYARSTTSGRA